MFVGQDIIEIDGIEHKPLRLTGDPDKVEVGNVTNRHAAVILLVVLQRARQYVLDSLSKAAPSAGGGRFGGGGGGGGGNRDNNSSFNDYGSRVRYQR